MGIRTKEKLAKMLEVQLQEESINVIEDAERELLDDTPEAYIQRQIGFFKRNGKTKRKIRWIKTKR